MNFKTLMELFKSSIIAWKEYTAGLDKERGDSRISEQSKIIGG